MFNSLFFIAKNSSNLHFEINQMLFGQVQGYCYKKVVWPDSDSLLYNFHSRVICIYSFYLKYITFAMSFHKNVINVDFSLIILYGNHQLHSLCSLFHYFSLDTLL